MTSFLGSLILHIAILASFTLLSFSSAPTRSASIERAPQERMIQVNLVKENISKATTEKNLLQRAVPKSTKKTTQKPVKALPKKTEKKKSETSDKAARKEVSASKKQAGTDDYKAKVRSWLERYKTYPRRARAIRMKGEAVVNFTIAADGYVLASHLTSSSGHEILDSATMQAVRKASPFPPFPTDLQKKQINISVPFAYHTE